MENKKKKPLGWYYHKLICEIGWKIRNIINWDLYYHHLNKMCEYGFNLYGEKIPTNTTAGKTKALMKTFTVVYQKPNDSAFHQFIELASSKDLAEAAFFDQIGVGFEIIKIFESN